MEETPIPLCTNSSISPNNPSNPPCLCTPSANLPGCTVAPCRQGENSTGSYKCQCTDDFQPKFCVRLRCDNGTTPMASHYPFNSYPEFSYPSPNYQLPSIPSSNYPLYSYPLPSYSTYSSSYAASNNFCGCKHSPPADCKHNSSEPIAGGPACACNMDYWRTGCTLKSCQDGDESNNGKYSCECTIFNSPEFCRMPRCSP